jgi:formate hydrogenlyase subunit 3/multisubunit Na+/H+ antiporter MnhD subunit
MTAHGGLLLLLVLLPLAAAALRWTLSGRGAGARTAVMLGATALTFLVAVALAPAVLEHGRVDASVPALLGELRFALDGVGLLLALVASLVWVGATLAASDALGSDRAPAALRYDLTSLLSLAAMLALVAAADLVTLYLAFEWLGLVAYLFVVHRGGAAAEAAGRKYLVVTVLGGFAVLTGALIVHALHGGDLATPVPVVPGSEGLRVAAAVVLLLGFGVKAGVIGLHVWLPDAHSAAPAPASALLSGVMIKAGAYGILRTVTVLFGPSDSAVAAPAPDVLALALVWVGVATMLIGVTAALWQHHPKRLLAYSSVSQMGYVVVGIGAAALLGAQGAGAWGGTFMHLVQHALSKAVLFIAVGIAIAHAGAADLRRPAGLARAAPWTFAFAALAAAGIAGVPPLAGFAGKSVVHHALEYAAALAPGAGLSVAERLFTLATVGTAAVMVTLIARTFLGRPASGAPRSRREAGWPALAAMGLLSAAAVVTAAWPTYIAAATASALASAQVPAHELVAALRAPLTTGADVGAALLALALGVAVHRLARRVPALQREPPAFASLDRAYLALLRAAGRAAERLLAVSVDWEGAWTRLRAASDAAARAPRAVAEVVPTGERLERVGPGARTALRAAERRWRRALRAAWSFTRRAAAGLDRQLDQSQRLARDASRGLAAMGEDERFLSAARVRIERHSRDVGLGVGLVVVLWLALLASLLLGGR